MSNRTEPITISLCMIVKNEELTLARCLDSVRDLVDEINIVDTGSTDRTKEIAAQYTDRIFDFEWIYDFSAARNYSFSHATKEYILWLDADDYFIEEDRQKLRKLKEELDPSVDMVAMDYNLTYDPNGRPIDRIRRERLVRRELDYRWHDPIHEYLEFKGVLTHSDVAVSHGRVHQNKTRNLDIYERRLASGETFGPRDHQNFASELLDNGRAADAATHFMRYLELVEPNFAANDDTSLREENILVCTRLSYCHQLLGDPAKELEWLLAAMRYDAPQADICCRIGLWHQDREMFRTAVRWFELAAKLERPDDLWGHVNLAAYTWLPHQHLTLLYAQLGDLDKSYAHNEIVLTYLPEDANLLHNRQRLEALLAERDSARDNAAGADSADASAYSSKPQT
ncbi:glycosyltransferase [Cohnella rhizosphaerae]|uniref:Glycosyltransferase family 2 protein n=1 Tax=Cohnella rhizosphaerae TaxID=1457232 RepID=A0A9X4QSL1_9BACL|nr:glycosyltransferase family 2 protein [Cohnella rhizosphaerae]MDG0808677.1 glycosyltransferase family 2 protein [Cohnella rhizosphaerae]